ncbi:MAG: histidine ammonia-lyase [Planctomycetes bacterium]|nr:histidine ammonia-lyase [Planctomycetota bacterium]
MHAIELGGRGLTLEDLAPVLRGEGVRVSLAEEARRRVAAARRGLETRIAGGQVVYGVNTGFGRFARVRVSEADARTLQRNLLLSHACGTGEPLPEGVARLALLLRIQALAQGRSGVRLELVERLLAFLDGGLVPVVPSQGSVGASGDLAPLSHLALPLLGLGEAWVGGKRMDGAAALARLSLPPFELEAKEGLSLINGTQVSTAVGIAAAEAARTLSKSADAIGALTLEALKGSAGPFDERLARLRSHPGHGRCAANLRRCLEGSEVLPSHRDCDKVQDAYSLRCMPQVHGASKDALRFAAGVLEREANAVTDNPVVLEEGEVVNGGNFHGQPLASALDFLSIALATWANVAERRVEQLVNPDHSGLPAFLTRKGGLNSGLMMPQVVAAAIVSEGKTLAHPASVDSIPTSAAREDFVPMSLWAARKAGMLAANAGTVLGIEALCAAQAREFTTGLRAGRGAEAAFAAVRSRVAPLGDDRLLAPDLEAAGDLVASGALLAAVEREVGPLEW